MLKKHPVVMLPVNEKASIILSETDKKLKLNGRDSFFAGHYQHLYFLSDEEIKEGDWFYDSCFGVNNGIYKHLKGFINKTSKKIIATTDNLLVPSIVEPRLGMYLPQPSESFIEKYIEKYNKGEQIKEVMVEYEGSKFIKGKLTNWNKDGEVEPFLHTLEYKIKVNPKDNTITIKPIKDSWNREEVIEFAEKFYNRFDFGFSTKIEYNSEDLKWIEQNL
jgi:hypothetical protein